MCAIARNGVACRPVSDLSNDLMTTAARLYYLDQLDQHQVAAILGVSRSKVSRLLTQAREYGIVRISVDPHDPRDDELERRLRERFGLQRVVVVKALSRSADSVRRTTGYFAAPVLAGLIRPRMTIGAAGGRTVGELIDALPSRPEVRDLTVIQLMGYIDPTARRFDAPEVGRILAERYGGSFYTLHTPAFVDDRQTRDALLAHEHIRMIWRQFASLDLALVGVGTLEESMFAERRILPPAACQHLRAQGAVGEICGRFFDREGQECAAEYRDRVIGIDLDYLRRCPEVIAVTHGPSRSEAVAAAVRGGLITSLIIDDLGAAALLQTAFTPALTRMASRSRERERSV
jgi:deoxyribonucleoside regulator